MVAIQNSLRFNLLSDTSIEPNLLKTNAATRGWLSVLRDGRYSPRVSPINHLPSHFSLIMRLEIWMINIQYIQQLHCSRVFIVRWNLKEAGCGEHTNPWANLWSDEQKSHIRSRTRVRLPPKSKPNNYTESCVINEADGWRGRNVWYPGRSVRYALKEVTIA